MKFFMFILAIAVPVQSYASADDIYGWDIQCVGTKGLKFRASQSDDDFYIVRQAGPLKFKRIWADSKQRYSKAHVTLVFESKPQNNEPGDASLKLVITREKTSGFSYAKGTFYYNGQPSDVNCFARYGVDEEEYATISGQAFPKIDAPKN